MIVASSAAASLMLAYLVRLPRQSRLDHDALINDDFIVMVRARMRAAAIAGFFVGPHTSMHPRLLAEVPRRVKARTAERRRWDGLRCWLFALVDGRLAEEGERERNGEVQTSAKEERVREWKPNRGAVLVDVRGLLRRSRRSDV